MEECNNKYLKHQNTDGMWRDIFTQRVTNIRTCLSGNVHFSFSGFRCIAKSADFAITYNSEVELIYVSLTLFLLL